MYTQLGVLTKGTIIEVNVSELGMVTTGGKAVVAKYAQVTNNPVSYPRTVVELLTQQSLRKTMAALMPFSVSSHFLSYEPQTDILQLFDLFSCILCN